MAESDDIPLSRKDRLLGMIELLRDGAVHRAVDMARQFNVSERSVYRDMATLQASGVPVAGERGTGYSMTAPVTLPPMNLSMEELESLHLGLAVMTEAEDPTLREAARSLARKLDQALPENRLSQTHSWGLAVYPFADTAAGIRHMPALRSAIRERRKLRVIYSELSGRSFRGIVRPLKLDYWGRVWTCTVWAEDTAAFKALRVDRLQNVDPAPGAFHEDAGQHLKDLKGWNAP